MLEAPTEREASWGTSQSVPVTNADNISILYEEPNPQNPAVKRHYIGTWDQKNFALVAYHSDDHGTDLQVDRSDNYDNIQNGHLPQKLGFTGHFKDVWTQNNQIFFTEKMPSQGSKDPSVLQYCMYSGSGYYYIDNIDANSALMDLNFPPYTYTTFAPKPYLQRLFAYISFVSIHGHKRDMLTKF